MEATLAFLRGANRLVALVAGVALVGCGLFILAEIVLRQAGASLGGSDEIAGYAMAGITVWGFSFALTERAHVRIDLARTRLPSLGRALLDLTALLSLAFVASVVAVQSWPVLSRSIANASRANTPLETPLWIPQSIWFAGLVWFALVSCVLTMIALRLIVQGRPGEVEVAAGPQGED